MNTDLLKQNEQTAVAMVVVDLSANDLPDLDDAQVLPMELTTLYWTPEKPGESKRMYFDCVKFREMPAKEEGGQPEILPCAHFYEKVDGEVIAICNASKRLVAAIEGSFVKRGTPLIVTYQGKKKNSTNAFQSDSWSIKPLVPAGYLLQQHVTEKVNASATDPVGFEDPEVSDPAEKKGEQPSSGSSKPAPF